MAEDYSAEDILIDLAMKAAEEATVQYLKDNPDQWYPCGFASVKIRPARGRFVTALKERAIGGLDDFAGGYLVYNPSGNSTQCMDAKEAGAKAFVEIVKKAYPDMKIRVESRVD